VLAANASEKAYVLGGSGGGVVTGMQTLGVGGGGGRRTPARKAGGGGGGRGAWEEEGAGGDVDADVVGSAVEALSTMELGSQVRSLTLKQTLGFIDELYASKEKFDEKAKESHLPRETMEQHMYTFLNQRYGLKQLIVENASAVIKAVNAFGATENAVAVFGKIIRNEIDEEFRCVRAKRARGASARCEREVRAKRAQTSSARCERSEVLRGASEESAKKFCLGTCHGAALSRRRPATVPPCLGACLGALPRGPASAPCPGALPRLSASAPSD
jgi:hypothetical protein